MRFSILAFIFLFVVPIFASETGKPVPDFFMLSLENESVNISDFKGAPLVLNFFAEWCEPCKKELPELAELEKRFPKVRFISVEIEQKNAQNVVNFLKSLPAYPKEIYYIYGSKITWDLTKVSEGLPLTWVIDDKLILRNKLRGFDLETLIFAVKAVSQQ